MEISDIQYENEMVVITFCDNDGKDILTIKISRDDAWQIASFCKNQLSYAAQLKDK